MTSHHGMVRDTTEFGLLRMIGVLATIFPLAGLIQVLVNLGDYRQPAVAVAVWLALFPVAVWLVPRIRGDGLTRGEAVAAILIATAAVAAIGVEYRAHDASGRVDLAILGTAWLLAMVALSCPPRVWIPGALIIFTVHAVLLLRAMGANPPSLAQLEAAGYILAIVLLTFAALRPTIAVHTTISARRAALASRSVAERAAAAAVVEDRRRRLAVLEMEALPLLRAIADGTLDPTAADVRERCDRHAAAMRHSLTDSLSDRAPSTDGLLTRLEPALQAARARGLLVDVQVMGDPGIPAPEVARAVLATVDAVISALRSGSGSGSDEVMLTIIASGDDVELYMTFGEPLLVSPDVAGFGRDVPAAACWRATVMAEQASGCLEITWRKAVLLDRLDRRH